SAVILIAATANVPFEINKKKLHLSFSTLGCPEWTFSQIVNFANEHGYTGIELRGIQHEMDLTKCKEFNSAQSKKDTLALMKEKGLAFVDLGSSTNLHIAEATERQKNLDEGKRFIDLAQEIQCPYVRVFPNKLPPEQSKETTINLIVKG